VLQHSVPEEVIDSSVVCNCEQGNGASHTPPRTAPVGWTRLVLAHAIV